LTRVTSIFYFFENIAIREYICEQKLHKVIKEQ